ncbi:hypothetical protein JMJ58_02450 [Haloterrigena salifodinae]|uniref:Uncharacterized protein n=1 Tax=Haloterrigena salifodinae TaxID=2675099 RepID=A0A8T8E2K3_9EURY|nr:hypothetical protein [Haloterrigena salifodinae]QRV15783.1 hypothetical protein JMJ58_02450 [Haloterrigena salifodinae]
MGPDETSSKQTETEQATDERSRTQRARKQPQREPVPAVPDRYAALSLAEDETFVYDQRNPDAWVQSDTARSLEHAA